MNKAVVTGFLCFLLLVSFTDYVFAGPNKWKIGHVRPSGSAIDQDIHRFVKQIKAETNGNILFDVYPASKLGDYSLVQERVSFGEVEMFVGPFGTAIDKKLALAFTPFLVSDWDEARKVYSNESILFEKMDNFLSGQNIKLIGGWPVYFGGIALTKEPVDPGNPDISKGMIIRVPPIRCFELTAGELGYTPYPITWMYAKLGLKTGMVEGIIGGGAEGYLGLKEIIKYYLPVKDHFEYWFVYMNLDLWKGLSEQNKKIIVNASKEMEIRRYATAAAEESASIEKLKEQGVRVIEFSETERSAMRAKIRKDVWPVMRKEIGPAFDEVTANH